MRCYIKNVPKQTSKANIYLELALLNPAKLVCKHVKYVISTYCVLN